jgi:hypothetical protein
MQIRAVTFVPVIAVTASCAALPPPDLGEPPSECHMFAPEAQLAWVGNGDPADYGLIREGITGAVPGDIYVKASRVARPGGPLPERRYCVVVPQDSPYGELVYGYPVPEGWEPPP